MLGAADLRAFLAKFDFPCEVRVGSEDYATPLDMAEYLASNIPNANLKVMEGVRHFSPLEVPAVIADALKTLVRARRKGTETLETVS
jgi:3-oxoadipate enol-lactonase